MSILLTNEFRPKSVDELILPESILSDIKSYIDKQEIPHLLFSGPAGTGKTSTALVLVNSICKSSADHLFINASLERGIDSMRNKISDFMATPPIASKIKIIVLDEADNLTNDALKSLRSLMENEQFNRLSATRFILTANYESGIIDAILSRLTKYRFEQVPKDLLAKHVQKILDKYGVAYDQSDIFDMVNDLHPDVRSVLNYIVKYIIGQKDKFVYDKTLGISSRNEIVNNLLKVIHQIEKTGLPSEVLLNDLIALVSRNENLLVDVIKIVLEKNAVPPHMFIVMNRYMNTFNSVISKSLHFQSMIYELIVANAKLNKLFTKGGD